MTGNNLVNDPRRTLQLCMEMEREMAEMYRDLARLHAADAALSNLWLKTAREEDNHAHQFDLALLYKDEIASVLLAPDEAEALLKVAREMRRRIAESPPSPEKSLRTAIELENRFTSYHMSAVATFQTTQLKRLFEAMMAADRDHSEALLAALAAR
jgi:rubrerythrin